MLDDLPMHILRQLSEFIRARQAEKLPVTRSGKMVERALQNWKDWLALQDFPQPVVPSRKPYAGHTRYSQKLSPEAAAATTKRNRRPSAIPLSASYSPPQDLHFPPTSAAIQNSIAGAADDIFVMDDVRGIPPLNVPNTRGNAPLVAQRDSTPISGTAYSPWKARISHSSRYGCQLLGCWKLLTTI